MIGLSICLALVDKVQQFSEEDKMIYSHSENESSLSFSALILSDFYVSAVLSGTCWYLTEVLICISHMSDEVKHFFNAYLPFGWLFVMCLFKTFFFQKNYFWLHWVFAAVLRVSQLRRAGTTLWLGCVGFSLPWLLLLWSIGSRARKLQ